MELSAPVPPVTVTVPPPLLFDPVLVVTGVETQTLRPRSQLCPWMVHCALDVQEVLPPVVPVGAPVLVGFVVGGIGF